MIKSTSKISRILFLSLACIVFSLSFGGCWTSKEEKQLLEATPFYESSRAYLREGKNDRAKEEIVKALERYPGYVEAHLVYQRIRAGEVGPEKLLDEYDRLLKQNQSDPSFHFLYARLLGEIEKQEAVLNRVVELDDRNPWGYFGLGWVAFKRSDYEAAAEFFRKSIELTPNKPLFHNDLGCVYFYQGTYDDAIAELTVARELDPLYPSAYANLATAYYQRGDFDLAVNMLEEYIRLAPSAPDISEMKIKLIQLRGK